MSYDSQSLVEQIYIALVRADMGLPTYDRRRWGAHGNQGLVRFPRYRGQIKRAKLPQPPTEA